MSWKLPLEFAIHLSWSIDDGLHEALCLSPTTTRRVFPPLRAGGFRRSPALVRPPRRGFGGMVFRPPGIPVGAFCDRFRTRPSAVFERARLDLSESRSELSVADSALGVLARARLLSPLLRPRAAVFAFLAGAGFWYCARDRAQHFVPTDALFTPSEKQFWTNFRASGTGKGNIHDSGADCTAPHSPSHVSLLCQVPL
jgi:hypothetical protein